MHIVVAAFAGVKSARRDQPNAPEVLREAVQALGTRADVHAGMRDAVILDFDRLKAEAAKRRA
jgi:hypothetical protein